MGSSTALSSAFAHENFAQDDDARHATGDGYRFLLNSGSARPWVFLPAQLLPFDGSAAGAGSGEHFFLNVLHEFPGSGAAFPSMRSRI